MKDKVVIVDNQCEFQKVYKEVFGHSPYYSLPEKEAFPMALGHIKDREVICQKTEYDKFVGRDANLTHKERQRIWFKEHYKGSIKSFEEFYNKVYNDTDEGLN